MAESWSSSWSNNNDTLRCLQTTLFVCSPERDRDLPWSRLVAFKSLGGLPEETAGETSVYCVPKNQNLITYSFILNSKKANAANYMLPPHGVASNASKICSKLGRSLGSVLRQARIRACRNGGHLSKRPHSEQVSWNADDFLSHSFGEVRTSSE